jgi:hypothetical protein
VDLKEEAILGAAVAEHWYYVAKGRALRRFLGPGAYDETLDVGAGSGVFTRQLLDAGIARRGVCVDPSYPSERVEAYHGREIAFVHRVDRVSQRLILMMDVLEHVDDDVGLLRAYTETMPDDAQVLITVPAFQFLWSGHDVFLEHKRRYTLTGVEAVIRRAGLRPKKCRYFFSLLFPLVAAMRLVDRLRLETGQVTAKSALSTHPPRLNALLVRIHDVERATLFRANRLAGLSVFCLAVKA